MPSVVVEGENGGYTLLRGERASNGVVNDGFGGMPPIKPPPEPATGGLRPWCSKCGAAVPKPCDRLDCHHRIIGDGSTYGAGWPD